MRTNAVVLGLAVVLVAAVGLLAACGGPGATETTVAPQEEQPTVQPAQPTEPPQEEQPTVPPTEVPQEEQPTEAPQEEPTEPPAVGDGAALLEERCTVCHGLDRTTAAQKTRDQWEQTVVRMVNKGAQLNEEELEILIAYLAETYGP